MALAERQLAASNAVTDDALEPSPLLWTKEQYHRMGELGLLDDARVELIEGVIYQMPPISSRHFTGVVLVEKALHGNFGDGYLVVAQNGFDCGPCSEPQPDIAIYEGGPRDFVDALPHSALLIVEVSRSTLSFDRKQKAAIYARIGIQDYWILNLRDNALEVHRQPTTLPKAPAAYQSVLTLTAPDTVSLLAAPNVVISVADLLP